MKPIKALSLAAVLVLAACGGNDNKTNEVVEEEEELESELASCPPAGKDSCLAGTKQNGEACESTASGLVTISGTVIDFQSERELSGAFVHLVDNDTGKPTGVCGKSDSNGKITLKAAKGTKSAYATFYDTAKDTYQFNLVYDADSEEDLFSVSEVTAQLIPGLIGFTPDETKGIVAGTVYNKYGNAVTDDAANNELLVKTAKGNEAYYFSDDDLPTDLASQDRLNPINALFVIFDLVPGAQEIQLTYGGKVTATTDNKLTAFPDSVAISNIVCTECEK